MSSHTHVGWTRAPSPDYRRAAMRPAIFVMTMLLLSACGGAGQVVKEDRAAPKNDASCLSAKGCPAASAALPACGEEARAARAVADVLAEAERAPGTDVVVRGRLDRGAPICTRRSCAGACCNRCGAQLALVGEAPIAQPADVPAPRIALAGEHMACRGDESLTCCDVEVKGQEVVARGRLRRVARTWTVDGATLCAIESPK